MARRTVGRQMVRAPRRPTFWEGSSAEFTLATGVRQAFVVVTEATLENTPNPTLIRIHGDVIANISARTAADDSAVLAMGIIPQSAAAIAAGVTAMPQPFDDIGSPWLWHRMISMRSNIAPPNGSDLLGNLRIVIDNKSMRKFDLNQGLVLVVQNLVRTGTLTIKGVTTHRFLFKR